MNNQPWIAVATRANGLPVIKAKGMHEVDGGVWKKVGYHVINIMRMPAMRVRVMAGGSWKGVRILLLPRT